VAGTGKASAESSDDPAGRASGSALVLLAHRFRFVYSVLC